MREYLLSSNQVLEELNTSDKGLNTSEASKRLENGKNKLMKLRKCL